MEYFRLIAISRQDTPEVAYIVEGEDMYYYVDKSTMCGDNGYIYPSTVVSVAGRFRYDWNKKVDDVALPHDVVSCIDHAQRDPQFRDLCTHVKQKLGAKNKILIGI